MRSMALPSYKRIHRQRGAALIVSLVFLLILTIISVASMQTATLQERMAGNMKEDTIAFQAAEAALRTGENFIANGILPSFNGTNGLFESCPDPDDDRAACLNPDWRDYASEGWVVTAVNVAGVAKQPEYIIQELNGVENKMVVLDSDRPVSKAGFFRIIARGYGASDRSMVVLTTTFKRLN